MKRDATVASLPEEVQGYRLHQRLLHLQLDDPALYLLLMGDNKLFRRRRKLVQLASAKSGMAEHLFEL